MFAMLLDHLGTAIMSGTVLHHISFDSGFYYWQAIMGKPSQDYVESWAESKL